MTWDKKGTKAEQLAAWTKLTPDAFGKVFKAVEPAVAATPWQKLAIGKKPILAACKQAERLNFIAELAEEVAAAERRAGRNAGEVKAMLVVLGDRGTAEAVIDAEQGFGSEDTNEAIRQAMRASALITVAGKPAGSGFLVAPDLVLTAGHVVLDTVLDGGGREVFTETLKPDVRFFFRSKNRVYDQEVAPAAPAKHPVAVAVPHATPPDALEVLLDDRSARNLDFALVRLAQEVGDVPHLDIQKPPAPRPRETFYVVGFLGGTAARWSMAKIAGVDPAAARIFHKANTASGMSGSCCLGPDGKPVALHEGSLLLVDDDDSPRGRRAQPPRINRAVALNSIRARLAALRPDPLTQRPRTPGLAFLDRPTLERWRTEARRLAGTRLAEWDKAVRDRLGFSPTDPDLPAFHPRFRRGTLEDWIHDARAATNERVRYVNGPAGCGKSFAARIVEEKIDYPARDLIQFDATIVTSWNGDDALTPLGESSHGEVMRTMAGEIRHRTVPAIVERLALIGNVERRPDQALFVAIDFDRDPGGGSRLRTENSPWQPFIQKLAGQPWARLVLIGLSEQEKSQLDDLFARDAVLSADLNLGPVGRAELEEFLRTALTSQGAIVQRRDLSPILDQWDGSGFHLASPELQTAEAVLFAMELTRPLWRPGG